MPSPDRPPEFHAHAAFRPNAAWLLWDAAARHGPRTALLDGTRETSYSDLHLQAAAVASRLRALGLAPGDRVGILLPRGAEAAATFFGILATGAIAININESLRARQVEHILAHSGARALVTTADTLAWLGRPPESQAVTILLDEPLAPGPFTPIPRTGHDPAHIIYTSGSTGLPKGVLVSHGNIWAGAQSVAAYTELVPEDRIASLLPFSFDYGFNQLLTSLLVGATLVIERSPLVSAVAHTLREASVTVLPCVPPLWLQLLATPSFRTTLPSLRAMTNTGGRVPEDAVKALRMAHPQAKLYLMYGLTEAFRSTYLPPDEVDRRPDSIGRAIPGAEVLVLTEDGTEAGPDEEGELVHRGPTVALGYWNDPEATAKVYRPHPLRPAGTPDVERVVYSGDLVRRDADGFLYYLGRRDRIIKTMGYRVSPDEVASVLYASKQVLEAVVTTEPDDARGHRIIAHVVLAPEGALDQLKRFVGAELPRYMQPARIETHATLPRTSSGKHDTRALSTEGAS